MKRIGLALAAGGTGIGATQLSLGKGWERYGTKYEQHKAQDKFQDLWNNIVAKPKTYGWYSTTALLGLFVESMDPSLHWVGDTFENSWIMRKKLIHSVGAVA